MPLKSYPSPSAGPLYSPRNPVLLALLVILVAGFVLLYEGFSRLFKREAAEPLPADKGILGLARNASR
jgi:hypothetical protein